MNSDHKEESKSFQSFTLSCLNESSFPTYFVDGCSVNSKTVKIKLLSLPPLLGNDTERFVHEASSGKRYDLQLNLFDANTKETTDTFLILNCQLINKSIDLSYRSNETICWDLEFSHSYFGEDKPQQILTINGKTYVSYGCEITQKNYNAQIIKFITKQQEKEFYFKTGDFSIYYNDVDKCASTIKTLHFGVELQVNGISRDGLLWVSRSNMGRTESNKITDWDWAWQWDNTETPSAKQ